MRKITMALIGAGDRGMDAHGLYALNNPHELKFVAVAEPNTDRRERFKSIHKIDDSMCFTSYEELLARPNLADAVLICTQDRMHLEPTKMALENGYHVLLEKPMSVSPKECIQMERVALKAKKILSVCHVLRYTRFFAALKELVSNGTIGRLISIQHNENIGFWHFAHSYVRGNWANSETSSPLILAKACHDMDIMLWLADADCVRISSFGSLEHFKSGNAPYGAPQRCLEGCPEELDCPFHASKTYLTKNTGWPTSVISGDTSLEARVKALWEGPYGRCVYKCDNNVCDHQVVNMEFLNNVTASFSLCAFTNEWCRTIKLMGTKGEIRGVMEKEEIEVTEFASGTRNIIKLKGIETGHYGGDSGLMHDFIKLVADGGQNSGLTSAGESVQSHLMAFAAEKSRLEKRIIELDDYRNEIMSQI